MHGIHQVFRNGLRPQRKDEMVYSMQHGNMPAMLSRAGSVFVLNRFFIPFELRWRKHDIKCGMLE